ncbi:MAG: transglutaminase-like domain-containing protein, partial [Oscillospiraceae bacterium]
VVTARLVTQKKITPKVTSQASSVKESKSVSTSSQSSSTVTQSKDTSTVAIESETVPQSSTPAIPKTVVLKPEASGVLAFSGGSASIDASNVSEGYVMVKYEGSSTKVKLQITGADSVIYTYSLNPSNNYETFPLTCGSGSYKVNVYENIQGTQYALALGETLDVQLSDSLKPYLYPNQYVNFNANSKTVAKGAELALGAKNDLEIVQNVYNYVIKNISYDDNKAQTVKSGYLPAVDSILANKKGICFDYAAVMATMLRTQNIPTKLEVGYASGNIYHAWISVHLKDIGWVNNIIYFDGSDWKLMDPTFASNANSSDSIMKFIGNGSNYSTKYVY